MEVALFTGLHTDITAPSTGIADNDVQCWKENQNDVLFIPNDILVTFEICNI